MAGGGVEVIRRAFEAFARGDVPTLMGFIDPDLEWTYLDPAFANPEPGICRGREACLALERGFRHRLASGLRTEVEEIAGSGDRVLVVEHVPGLDATRARHSNDRNHLVFTVREERVVALHAFRDRAQAATFAGVG